MCVFLSVVALLCGAWYGAKQIGVSLPSISFDERFTPLVYYFNGDANSVAPRSTSAMAELRSWRKAVIVWVEHQLEHLRTDSSYALLRRGLLGNSDLSPIIIVLSAFLLVIMLARCRRRRRESEEVRRSANTPGICLSPFTITKNRRSLGLGVCVSGRTSRTEFHEDDLYPRNGPDGDSASFLEESICPSPQVSDPLGSEDLSPLPRERESTDLRDPFGSPFSSKRLPKALLSPPNEKCMGGPPEDAFGELLHECKHAEPLTFNALLEEMVYSVWDKYPDIMRNACINFHSRKSFSVFDDEERDSCRPYVALYMSYAGRPLSKVEFESALQVRSVVQQLALTLAIGEAALELEHRALTPAHVLVKEAHDQVAPFWLDGRPLLIDMYGVQVTLVDFSTARLKTPGEDSQVLFADLAKMPEGKLMSLGDTFAKVYSVIREDLSRYYPWTNVAYLEALIKMLIKGYEGRFSDAPDEADRQAWRDVCFWLDELPYCGTAGDFVRELIVPSARSTTSLSTL
ncbi:hypothetical protein HPB50_002546 [Hyalomma asiaticum]|uniref:Uncharacterized protein n=1 Tax=Hyalomma asiaticum TaxID=266040 RepID=A0ACB7SUG3_HYAAI|nr:hypothetical protein HPB50_002546 [Hyalomma asiaticum]